MTNPTGTGTSMNFYSRVQVQISTHSLFAGGRVIALPDPNPARCHPYPGGAKPEGPGAPTINVKTSTVDPRESGAPTINVKTSTTGLREVSELKVRERPPST
jgi:hypothetical protein